VVTPEVFVGQYPDEPVRGRKEPYWGPHGYCGCHVAYQGQVYVLTERTLKVRPASGDSAQPPTPLSSWRCSRNLFRADKFFVGYREAAGDGCFASALVLIRSSSPGNCTVRPTGDTWLAAPGWQAVSPALT
jgi:hypothetical protein